MKRFGGPCPQMHLCGYQQECEISFYLLVSQVQTDKDASSWATYYCQGTGNRKALCVSALKGWILSPRRGMTANTDCQFD